MKTKAIYPPEIVDVKDGPVIFLAGPIQGAPNWQSDAILWFKKNTADLVIACPRDPGEWHELYNEQVDWETHYLKHASDIGHILFWLAKEEVHSCDRAYGQTSRFELGEWFGKYFWNPSPRIPFVLGVEKGFTNERYIRRRLGQAMPGLTIHDNLHDTCDDASKTHVPF